MYQPSINFERTPQEYADAELSWRRPDIAFFGAGACHILAFAFMQLHPDQGFAINHIRPINTQDGHHVFASNGEWAFDHNGWTQHNELLKANEAAERHHNTNWSYEIVAVTTTIEDFCQQNNHMPPSSFPHSPWERAYKYIEQLPALPPTSVARKQ